ncbi:PAS domain-containing protein [Ornithinibacillus sp. BX22]|uniref:histidine kinase n=2 Tax=Ornithinibacillus TaxID=484508 RepID=A0A923L8C4_9BACI|nr:MULTISPECIES: PAS domain-containing protein [Ornithinibacillus]MBC5638279.1 PAS domain-containing protein [Ornithinibacillus hominis]MBS3680941.1 PAS domain-containing protein [Ornithinibacillus massiliensis]
MTNNNRELNGQQKSQHLEEYINAQVKNKFTIASTGKEPFIIINLDHKIRYASNSNESILGYSPGELIDMSLYDIVPNDDLPITHFFRESLQSITTKAFTKNYREWIDVKLTLIPIYTNNELVGRYILLSEASTDNQSLEDITRKNGGSSYKNLIDHSPFGIIIIDDYKVEYINLLALRALGAKGRDSVIGKSIFNLVPAEDIELLREKIKQTNKSIIERPFKQKLLKLNGNLIEAEMQALPGIYKQKKMTHFIIRDLFESKKNFDLSILIATGVAYELKKPLIRLKGFIELIESGLDNKAYYNVIKKDITYMEKILDEILVLEGDKYEDTTGRDISDILSLIRNVMK